MGGCVSVYYVDPFIIWLHTVTARTQCGGCVVCVSCVYIRMYICSMQATPQKVIAYGMSRGRAGLDTAEEEEEKDEEGQEHEHLTDAC